MDEFEIKFAPRSLAPEGPKFAKNVWRYHTKSGMVGPVSYTLDEIHWVAEGVPTYILFIHEE